MNPNYSYSYVFDPIGNRTNATLAGTAYSYTANLLNQYTAVNADTPTHDDDGNMLTNGAWTYTWNGENRLISAVNGTQRLEFAYDYMGRRVFKKVYSAETLTKYLKFIYDGYKLVEELDGLNSDALSHRYVWQTDAVGLDVPVSVYDAATDKTYFYHTDANKNITELTDNTGAVVAHYEYSPFGMQTVISGALASDNPFRFSSEYYDAETGLVYYNYRYYSPRLGRWLSRDPIEEKGGDNLYGMVRNKIFNYWDNFGYDEGNPCLNWLLNNFKQSWKNTIKPFADARDRIAEYMVNSKNTSSATNYILNNDTRINIGGYADYAFWGGAGLSLELEASKDGIKVNLNFNSNLGYGASAGGYVGGSINSSTTVPLENVSIGSGIGIRGPVGVGFGSGGGRNAVNISAGKGFGVYGTASVTLFTR